jgi:hypothetical protein
LLFHMIVLRFHCDDRFALGRERALAESVRRLVVEGRLSRAWEIFFCLVARLSRARFPARCLRACRLSYDSITRSAHVRLQTLPRVRTQAHRRALLYAVWWLVLLPCLSGRGQRSAPARESRIGQCGGAGRCGCCAFRAADRRAQMGVREPIAWSLGLHTDRQ